MKRNDIIAEYVETRYPHLLKTADFTLFSMGVACREFAKCITKALSVLSVDQPGTSDQKQTEEKR